MRRYAIFSCLLWISCNGQLKETKTTATTNDKTSSPSQLCFQLLQGTRNQDTTTLQLMIRGASVTGAMNAVPFEKDSRKGIITGRLNDSIITGMWHFVQEGIKDSMPVEFKFSDNSLLQKGYTVDPQSGREQLSVSSEYTIKYSRIDCKN